MYQVAPYISPIFPYISPYFPYPPPFHCSQYIPQPVFAKVSLHVVFQTYFSFENIPFANEYTSQNYKKKYIKLFSISRKI